MVWRDSGRVNGAGDDMTDASGQRADMCEEERQVWRQLVKQANRYGHEGKRVIDVDVFCPTTAASDWRPLLILDNGPRTATEEW